MISWALFQFVTVPLVLLHVERGFAVAVGLFAGVSLTVAAVGAFLLIRSLRGGRRLFLVKGRATAGSIVSTGGFFWHWRPFN